MRREAEENDRLLSEELATVHLIAGNELGHQARRPPFRACVARARAHAGGCPQAGAAACVWRQRREPSPPRPEGVAAGRCRTGAPRRLRRSTQRPRREAAAR